MTSRRTTHNPMKEALDVIAKVFADPDAFPSDFVAFPLRGEMASRILTSERRRIIIYLEDHLLTDAGLLRMEEVGRTKHIHATGRPIIVA